MTAEEQARIAVQNALISRDADAYAVAEDACIEAGILHGRRWAPHPDDESDEMADAQCIFIIQAFAKAHP